MHQGFPRTMQHKIFLWTSHLCIAIVIPFSGSCPARWGIRSHGSSTLDSATCRWERSASTLQQIRQLRCLRYPHNEFAQYQLDSKGSYLRFSQCWQRIILRGISEQAYSKAAYKMGLGLNFACKPEVRTVSSFFLGTIRLWITIPSFGFQQFRWLWSG